MCIRCDQAVSAHQKVGGHTLLSGRIGGQCVGVQHSALALIRREIQSLCLLDSVVLLIYLVEGVGYLHLLCADRSLSTDQPHAVARYSVLVGFQLCTKR